MAKFMVHTSIGFVGCEHHDEIEIPDEELAGLDMGAVEKRVYEEAQEVADTHVEYHVTLGSDEEYGRGARRSLSEFELISAVVD